MIDPTRVTVPRDTPHVTAFRLGRGWHFVVLFPGGGEVCSFDYDQRGYRHRLDAEAAGRALLADTLAHGAARPEAAEAAR